MKIGMFTNSYLPLPNGVSHAIRDLKENLSKKGHEVYIIAPAFPGYEDKEDNIIRYPSIPFKYKVDYPIPFYSPSKNKKVIDLDFDMVHSHNPWGLGWLAVKVARKRNIPVLFTTHSAYSFFSKMYTPPVLPQKVRVKMVDKNVSRRLNSMDAVIAPTVQMEEELKRIGVKVPMHKIRSGVDFNKITKAKEIDLKRRYDIPEDYQVIVNVSRMGPEKNLETMLDVFKKILKECPKTKLVLVGGGSYLSTLKRKAKKLGVEDDVIFVGLVKPEEVGSYYKQADLFLHTSFSEVQPFVILEAMSASLPIVAFEANGVSDVLENGQNGVSTKEDSDELAKAAIKVLKDPKLAKKLSKGAFETSKEYSAQKGADRIEELYKLLIKKSDQ